MSIIDLQALRELIQQSKRSPRDISLKAGLGATAVRDILRGQSKNPGTGTIIAIAKELQVDPQRFVVGQINNERSHSLTGGEFLGPVGRKIPILGEVRAGVFHSLSEPEGPDDWLYFDDPNYANRTVAALKVVGNSINEIYADGTIILYVPIAETEIYVGDLVIVRRNLSGLTETTIKEIQPDGSGRWKLCPRSTDPRFQEPIIISRSYDADHGAEIVGVVIGSYAKRKRLRSATIAFDH